MKKLLEALLFTTASVAHAGDIGLWKEVDGWKVVGNTDGFCTATAAYDDGVFFTLVYNGNYWDFALGGIVFNGEKITTTKFIFDEKTVFDLTLYDSGDSIGLAGGVTNTFIGFVMKSHKVAIPDLGMEYPLDGSMNAAFETALCQTIMAATGV